QQYEYLDQLDKERQELNARARDLDKKRSEYIAKKQAESEKLRSADSFDVQVLQLLQVQARRVQIEYAAPLPAYTEPPAKKSPALGRSRVQGPQSAPDPPVQDLLHPRLRPRHGAAVHHAVVVDDAHGHLTVGDHAVIKGRGQRRQGVQ